jgi:hypothetical protein
LPKINTRASAQDVKNWKESAKTKNAYLKLNESTGHENETVCSIILQRSWTKHPTSEQMSFTFAIIKYIFNKNIYSIKIDDNDIRRYMKKIKVNIIYYFYSILSYIFNYIYYI